MKVEIKHSIVQDTSVVKFLSLDDYYRALKFLQNNDYSWTPLTYSSRNNTASIRVDEHVLQKLATRFGMRKQDANDNIDRGITGMR